MAQSDPRTIFGLDATASIALQASFVGFTTLMCGVMSGLTIGLFSLEETTLQAIVHGGAKKDRRRAKRVLPLFAHAHWVLVTLLVCNAGCAEAMPLALSRMLNSFLAVGISVTLQLLFGEVIPQAIFVRYALPVGAFFAYPVWFLMFLTAPVSYPLAKLLDCVVGHREAVFFRRRELREFIKLQAKRQVKDKNLEVDYNDSGSDQDKMYNEATREDEDDRNNLTDMEVRLMLGALDLAETTVAGAMKRPLDEVMMVEEDTVINKERIDAFFKAGFSRIPVYCGVRKNVISYLLTKSLVLLMFRSETDAPRAKNCSVRKPLYMLGSRPLGDLYDEFQASDCHVCVVINEKNEALGIVTINDVLERLHQTNILDETDLLSQHPVQMMMQEVQDRRMRGSGLYSGPNSSYGGGGGTPVGLGRVASKDNSLGSQSHGPRPRPPVLLAGEDTPVRVRDVSPSDRHSYGTTACGRDIPAAPPVPKGPRVSDCSQSGFPTAYGLTSIGFAGAEEDDGQRRSQQLTRFSGSLRRSRTKSYRESNGPLW